MSTSLEQGPTPLVLGFQTQVITQHLVLAVAAARTPIWHVPGETSDSTLSANSACSSAEPRYAGKCPESNFCPACSPQRLTNGIASSMAAGLHCLYLHSPG
jgi:hypothetical protein